MANKPVELHEEAAAEFDAAFDWYFERSALAAAKFNDEAIAALNLIVEAPQRWPAHVHGTRRFLLRHFPFAVVYRELRSSIQIIAFAHGRRRPGYWKTRL